MKDVTSFGLDVEAAQMPRSQSRQFVPHDKQCGDLKNPPGRTLPPHTGQNILISLSTLLLQAGHLGRNTMNKVWQAQLIQKREMETICRRKFHSSTQKTLVRTEQGKSL
jgi:hypothetical protein